jgi:hypothetical protein
MELKIIYCRYNKTNELYYKTFRNEEYIECAQMQESAIKDIQQLGKEKRSFFILWR